MNRKRTVKLNKICNNEYKELRFKSVCVLQVVTTDIFYKDQLITILGR